LENHSGQLFLFGWKHGSEIEQQPVVFDPRDDGRLAQTAAALGFDDVVALDGDKPACERLLGRRTAADE
jgi:hypothetical protein